MTVELCHWKAEAVTDTRKQTGMAVFQQNSIYKSRHGPADPAFLPLAYRSLPVAMQRLCPPLKPCPHCACVSLQLPVTPRRQLPDLLRALPSASLRLLSRGFAWERHVPLEAHDRMWGYGVGGDKGALRI